MSKVNIVNKKAGFEFEIIEKFTAGIMLTGTEIKSVRESKANISDAYCSFTGDELYIRNLHISEYSHGTHYNHEPKRHRKLLLKRQELKKLHTKVKERGFTIVPLKVFISGSGFAKVDIALGRGKKTFDKRASLKEKDVKREMDRRGD